MPKVRRAVTLSRGPLRLMYQPTEAPQGPSVRSALRHGEGGSGSRLADSCFRKTDALFERSNEIRGTWPHGRRVLAGVTGCQGLTATTQTMRQWSNIDDDCGQTREQFDRSVSEQRCLTLARLQNVTLLRRRVSSVGSLAEQTRLRRQWKGLSDGRGLFVYGNKHPLENTRPTH